MAEALRTRRLGQRLSWAALILSLGGLIVALVAAAGAGQGLWHFGTGFTLLRYAWFAAIVGGLLAVAALFVVRRGGLHGLTRVALLALIVSLIFVLYLGSQIVTARSVPAIHDVTTNLDNPPSFYRLHIRRDNLANVPDLGRPPLARLSPRERWKAVHAEAYGDLKAIRLPLTVDETLAKAERLARARDWEIATVDRRNGILEATDTSFFFGFKDDVVLRVRPVGTGGTIVDMRSISRVGGSDVGVNAARIRAFLKDLQAA